MSLRSSSVTSTRSPLTHFIPRLDTTKSAVGLDSWYTTKSRAPERQVNVSRRAGALLNVAAKLPVHPGPEAATVDKATHDRAFEGEKRNE
jgi:hypothetical protein